MFLASRLFFDDVLALSHRRDRIFTSHCSSDGYWGDFPGNYENALHHGRIGIEAGEGLEAWCERLFH